MNKLVKNTGEQSMKERSVMMMNEQHPEERIMQEEAERTNFELDRYSEHMEKLHKERNEKIENLLAQIRLVKDVCEDAENNIKSIIESL